MDFAALLIGAALAAQPNASPAARQADEVLMPADPRNRALFERWGFAEAVIDGDRVYLSGVVAVLREGETDPSAAYDRAFKIVADVLARSGSGWDSVIDMTTYHTDLSAQMDSFIAVKHRYVKAPFHAWTAIGVDRLVPDRGLVEIKVVARRANPPR